MLSVNIPAAVETRQALPEPVSPAQLIGILSFHLAEKSVPGVFRAKPGQEMAFAGPSRGRDEQRRRSPGPAQPLTLVYRSDRFREKIDRFLVKCGQSRLSGERAGKDIFSERIHVLGMGA